jgi:hypothetical protein
VRLERTPRAPLDEQSLEHALDMIRRAENLLDLGAPAARVHDGEIPRRNVPDSFRVENHRHTGGEVRLADDQLPAATDLDDDALLGQLGLKP